MTRKLERTQPFTSDFPCPVCGGHSRLLRGQGKRCYGFLSSNGQHVHCTREDYAANLPQEDGGTFAHLLDGQCACGVIHGESPPPMAAEQGGHHEPRCIGVKRYHISGEDGSVRAVHVRRDFADGSQQVHWEQAVDLPLYGIDEVGSPSAVVLVEGEKALDALAGLGITAVAAVPVAKPVPSAECLAPLLRAETVYPWPDNDGNATRRGGQSHDAWGGAAMTPASQITLSNTGHVATIPAPHRRQGNRSGVRR